MRTAFLALGCAHSEILFAINPVHALGIHLPALAPQHHRQPAIAITWSVAGQFPQPLSQLVLRITPASITIDPPCDPHQPACALLAQLVLLADATNQLPARCRLQTFFDST